MTCADIVAANERLRGVARRTQVITSRSLNELLNADIFLKCENFQRGGSFKLRGAYNRIAQLSPKERAAGVVTYSSGNHAQGVALASQLLGVRSTIVMPDDAPSAKIAATREYGGKIVFYRRDKEDRSAIALGICGETGATLVPPFDDSHIIAGQGTVALELMQDTPELDIVLVALGGGGLLSGTLLACAELRPAIEVFGVEPEAGHVFKQSLAVGRRITIPLPHTIADALRTQEPGELTFPIVRRYAKGVLTVTDSEIKAAMRFAFERLKIVIEPSGALGLAAAMHRKVDLNKKRVGIIVSGGNVDPSQYAEALIHA